MHGQGDLVSRFYNNADTWGDDVDYGVRNLLSPHDPPSKVLRGRFRTWHLKFKACGFSDLRLRISGFGLGI